MSIQSKGTLPVVLLKDGASETKGREAQKNNIQAAKIIAEIVHSSLGPRGMDKMLVDSLGGDLRRFPRAHEVDTEDARRLSPSPCGD